MKLQDYCTKEEYQYYRSGGLEPIVLPAGTFVKILEPIYLPRHIKESDDYKYYKPETQSWVYCHFGIIVLPDKIIRKI
jgi:hypothetical protein